MLTLKFSILIPPFKLKSYIRNFKFLSFIYLEK
nr:MAG TPA: hypothetical protein [Caudoviricetes sp.]